MLYLKEFFTFQSDVRNLSGTTLETYRVSLKLYAVYLAENGINGAEQATTADVAAFIAGERQRGCSAPTCNCRLAALRTYYDYLCRFQGVQFNPCVDIRPMRTPRNLPDAINEDTMHEVLNQFDTTSWHGARAAAIVTTLYMCGFRISELRTLKLGQVDFTQNTIKVFGKGSKERVVPMSRQVVQSIRNWLRFRWGDVSEVFTDNHGNALTDDKLRYIIKQSLSPFVPAHLAHPHALRHSFATTLVNHGVPLPKISRMLGHASLATTYIYIAAGEPQTNPFDDYVNL